MGRPPLDIGTYGAIRCYETDSGWRATVKYRDYDGVLHERSAVCPHLGCIVAFDDVEKTWDCPCHGSRFDRYGRVIVGPANRDLAPSPHAEHAARRRVK